MNDGLPIGLVVLMVCSVFAPTVAADTTQSDSIQDRATVEAPTESQSAPPSQEQTSPERPASIQEVDEVSYDELSDQLRALARVDTEADVSVNETLSQAQRDAAREGALEGVQLARDQGVNVSSAHIDPAVNSSLRAAAQFQNASAEQIQSATRGAAHGALLQSQHVNVTQVQAGVYGSAAGALSQSASATQQQAAAYGAAHGTVAQSQRANVTQIQFAAVGAAAGAAHAGAQSDSASAQSQSVNVTQVQEAAQGGAYGSLESRQSVNVTQVQAAAFGAAGGAASSDEGADPKKVQESAMGAAKGALTQSQQVTITQVQAAARGACKGALAQSQNATVIQIQQSAMGAAEGALTQSQSATVVQIQSAAMGAASGTITQVQSVSVVQIQHAAAGAAQGAVASAVQYQVTNVRQIQAAAAGAASGTVVQIQQINIVQIQVIAGSAASGALSQHQEASVVQIQSAARGASEGSMARTQAQSVSVEQIQTATQRAAADTVRTAVEINVTQEVTIYVYAKGAAESPEADDDDDDGDDADRLQSLFASVDDGTVFLANPNDVAVTVTVTGDGDDLQTVTLSPGESSTVELDPGTYTLTAETEDGRDVELAGRTELTVSVGDELQSLTATVDNQTLSVENPNDQRVVVTAVGDDGQSETFEVPRDWTVTQRLDPGTYTVTAETAEGRTVQVNGDSAAEVTIESVAAEPEAIDLDASVDGQTLTLENPSDANVTVTAAVDEGDEQTIEVAGGATETRTLDPGTYTLTGESDGDRPVVLNGQSSYEFTISQVGPIDLSVTVDDGNVSIENPGDAAVTVTAAAESEDVEDRTIEVDAGETATAQFEPGTYTLTGESGDRDVLLNGSTSLTVTIEADAPEVDRTIDECRNVTAPGAYDLTADVQATEQETCLQVQSSNVTIDGNGYSIEGPGPIEDPEFGTVNAGIWVYNESETPIENVSVRNVSASGWNQGLAVDVVGFGGVADVSVADSEFSANDRGLALRGADADVTNVTLAENSLGLFAGEVGEIAVDDSTIERNEDGLYAIETEQVTVESSVVRENDDFGLATDTASPLAVRNTTVSNNTGDGVRAQNQGSELSMVNATVADNGLNGVALFEHSGAALENVTIAGNDGAGVVEEAAFEDATVTDSLIEANGGPGVSVGADVTGTVVNDTTVRNNAGDGLEVNGSATLEGVTVLDNAGLALDALDGTVAATDLQVGASATATFDEQSVALDAVGQSALPALPEDATALGPGLNATGVDEPIDVRLGYDAEADDANESDGADDETDGDETDGTETDAADDAVELWRHDGTEWTVVGNETADGDVVGTVTDDGIYAPVDAPDDAELAANATVGNRVVWVENPTDGQLAVNVTNESGTVRSLQVDAGANESITGLAPGEYALTAATADGESVPVNGETEWQFTLPPDLESLSLTVADNVTADNPNDESVDLTVENESGVVTTLAVPADATAQVDASDLETGNYTAHAETADGSSVPVDGQWNLTFAYERPEELAGTPTPTGTDTDTVTPNGTDTDTATPNGTDTDTATPNGTDTATATATPTEAPTDAETETATGTPVGVETETDGPTETAAPTGTETAAPTETETAAPTGTETAAPTETETAAPAPTETETAPSTTTDAATPTSTATPTQTATSNETTTPNGTATTAASAPAGAATTIAVAVSDLVDSVSSLL